MDKPRSFAKPHPTSRNEIHDIIHRFFHAPIYLQKAGYDGIQLHTAHGYLLARFLSQTTNKGNEDYGGSPENRVRIIVDIARAVRQAILSPGFLVGIKINSVEFQANGLTPGEAKELCIILEKANFDIVELSDGTYESLAFQHKETLSRNARLSSWNLHTLSPCSQKNSHISHRRF